MKRFVITAAILALMLGCKTTKLDLDARTPSIEVKVSGFYLADQKVSGQDILDALDDFDIPKTRTIHIRVDPEVKDFRDARSLMGFLASHGYTRPVLVTPRHAESLIEETKNPAAAAPAARPVIHWK